ncbi:hypothetical protein BC826DRAFT_1186500 [Russula brevipes]|nr:hypothetical protein BC826DRAFT_1186500 [Russula brevipes]
MPTTCSLPLVSMASAVGFLLAFSFILTWMSFDSAMALAMPASVKHHLGGTWSATCQELAFYSIFVAGCLFLVVRPYILQMVRGPRASAVVATLDHDATPRHATCPFPFSLPFAANDGAGPPAPRRVPVRNGGVAYPVSARGRWYERQSAPESIV